MSSAGPLLPTFATGNTNTVGGGTRTWTNPGFIVAADGNNALCAFLALNASSNDLVGFGFGFGVPATAVIDGILLEINYVQTVGAGSIQEKNVKLMKAGVAVGSDLSTGATLPGTAATASYGGASNLWGTTWTPADINDNNFGAVFVCQDSAGLSATAGVDFFRITVFFHNVFNDGFTLTNTASIVESPANKMNAAMSISATTGMSFIDNLSMVTSLAFSNTAGFSDTGTNIPGTPSFSLSATPSVTMLGTVSTGAMGLAFSLTAGLSDSGVTGGTRGIAFPVSPSMFINADVGGRPVASADDYLSLVTSEHNKRPNFMAMIAQDVQGHVDNINLLRNFQNLFDIDQAVGQQLDMVGIWIGITRNILVPLTGVYFSFGVASLGFNIGTWFGAGDSLSGITVLSDDQYRLLLKAKIASNHWDGTVPGAYAIWAIVFQSQGFNILISDGQDMSMAIIIVGTTIPAVTLSLLVNGYIALRPAGVLISGYYQITVPNFPVFGFGVENATVAGFNDGAWVQKIG